MYSQSKNSSLSAAQPPTSPYGTESPVPDKKPVAVSEAADKHEEVADELRDEALLDYARSIGIDPEKEPHLLWIAEQGFTAPLDRRQWNIVPIDDENDFYFVNRKTGEASWDHPLDEHFKQLAQNIREGKKVTVDDSGQPDSSTMSSLQLPTVVITPKSDSSQSDSEEVLSADTRTFGSPSDSDDYKAWSEAYSNSNGNANLVEELPFDSDEEREGKKVTFSKHLVEVLEFKNDNLQWMRKNLFQKDSEKPQPMPIEEAKGDGQKGPRLIPTERFHSLKSLDQRVAMVMARNWRIYCTSVAESYARCHRLANSIAAPPPTPPNERER